MSANRAVGQTNLGAATSNYWQVTGVQIEVGSVSTPFEFEDIGTTFVKCQRYYEQEYVATWTQTIATSERFTVPIPFLVRKRTVPSTTLANITSNIGTVYTINTGGGNSRSAASADFTSGTFGIAQVYFEYKASAEL